MKTIEMPKEGTLFSENKDVKLDYVAHGNFVNTTLFVENKRQVHGALTKISFKKIEKCVFNKAQFEKYLYSNLLVDDQVEIIFK